MVQIALDAIAGKFNQQFGMGDAFECWFEVDIRSLYWQIFCGQEKLSNRADFWVD